MKNTILIISIFFISSCASSLTMGGIENTVPISYGYPPPEAVEDSKKRDVHFGGCVIDVINQRL